jgi:hypothetical protein
MDGCSLAWPLSSDKLQAAVRKPHPSPSHLDAGALDSLNNCTHPRRSFVKIADDLQLYGLRRLALLHPRFPRQQVTGQPEHVGITKGTFFAVNSVLSFVGVHVQCSPNSGYPRVAATLLADDGQPSNNCSKDALVNGTEHRRLAAVCGSAFVAQRRLDSKSSVSGTRQHLRWHMQQHDSASINHQKGILGHATFATGCR